MIDFAREPARQQAVKLNCFEALLRRLCAASATCWHRRGIRMHNQKKCAYRLCGKPIEQGKEVTGKLTLIHGAQLKHEERDYCCARCASYDQMAHES